MVTHLHLEHCDPSRVWQNLFLDQLCLYTQCEVGECQIPQRPGGAVSRGRVGAGDPAAGLGCRQGCAPHSCPRGCSGRRPQSPSPGVAGVAAGLRRSCPSGQGETPPHANVASQRAYATLARPAPHGPSPTIHGASPGGCTRPISVLPTPRRTQLGSPGKTQWHRLSVHHCGEHSPSGGADGGATSLGAAW